MLLENQQREQVTGIIKTAKASFERRGTFSPEEQLGEIRSRLHEAATEISGLMTGPDLGEFYQFTMFNPLTAQSSEQEVQQYEDLAEFRREIDGYKRQFLRETVIDLLSLSQNHSFDQFDLLQNLGITLTIHQLEQGTCVEFEFTQEGEQSEPVSLASYLENTNGIGLNLQRGLQENFLGNFAAEETYNPSFVICHYRQSGQL